MNEREEDQAAPFSEATCVQQYSIEREKKKRRGEFNVEHGKKVGERVEGFIADVFVRNERGGE